MSDRGASFLSRWSRRKRAAANEPVPPSAPPIAAAPPDPAVEAAPAGSISPEAPAFDPAGLPPLESLTAESDFTAFLREEVPAALRQAALRRAWSLDPAIRTFTGPADYAWDFNAPDGGMAGFSPTLAGDVQRLLAQAIGLDAAPVEEAPGERPLPEAGIVLPATAAEPDAVPDTPEPLEAPVEAPVEAQDALPTSAVSLVAAPAALEAPSLLPAPPAPVVEAPRARRRHGGALPT